MWHFEYVVLVYSAETEVVHQLYRDYTAETEGVNLIIKIDVVSGVISQNRMVALGDPFIDLAPERMLVWGCATSLLGSGAGISFPANEAAPGHGRRGTAPQLHGHTPHGGWSVSP